MGPHRDDSEHAVSKPIVSVSMGRPAVFLLGGTTKDDPVVDEVGEPVLGAIVQVLRRTWVRGRRQMMPAGSGTTNDLGAYRVFGLPAAAALEVDSEDGRILHSTDSLSASTTSHLLLQGLAAELVHCQRAVARDKLRSDSLESVYLRRLFEVLFPADKLQQTLLAVLDAADGCKLL